MENAARWFVIYTRPQSEDDAVRNLVRQEFTTFLPKYNKRRRHARKIDWVQRPLFPRYVFVAMDLANARWRAISSTIGVKHLVCRNDMPLPVPEGVVEEIQARLGGDGTIAVEPKVPFRGGDQVQVVSGVFADRFGLFECATDEERVVLLLDILGRQVRVKVPMETVAAVS
jgi:transcriptional antiterminator RfaH